MFKIGIMQGRVLPEDINKLQVFPVSKWQEELEQIKKLGFDSVEFLYDKDLVCQELLTKSNNRNESEFYQNIIKNKIITGNSFCLDYLSSFSSLKNFRRFFDTITFLMRIFETSSIKHFVVPFFDANSIETGEEFNSFCQSIKESELDALACKYGIKLALELNLPAQQIKAVLKKITFSNIGICYDLGNARAAGLIPELEILELGDLLYHIHIKDRKIDGPNVMLGDGDVNFLKCLTSLTEIAYKGQLILETKYFNNPKEEALKNFNFIKKIVQEINE